MTDLLQYGSKIGMGLSWVFNFIFNCGWIRVSFQSPELQLSSKSHTGVKWNVGEFVAVV